MESLGENRAASVEADELNATQGASSLAMRVPTSSENPKRLASIVIRRRERRKRRPRDRRVVRVAKGQTMFDFDSVLVPE